MQGFLNILSVVSFIILIVGIVVWFIRMFTKKAFSKRSKVVMWSSLAILVISFIFIDSPTSESETAIEEEIQPVVEAEEPKEESETDKEAALVKEKEAEAEKARLAEEKLAAEKKAEEERIVAEKKAAEEKAAAEKLAAEKKAAEEAAIAERLALEQKVAEEKAATERLALEQKAAEEKAAQAAAASAASVPAASENFSNCTELRTVYPGGVPEGHGAYQSKMDRDKDGYACEA